MEKPAASDTGSLAHDIWIPIACGLSDGAGYIKFDLCSLNEAARVILWRGLALGLSGGPAEIEVRSSLAPNHRLGLLSSIAGKGMAVGKEMLSSEGMFDMARLVQLLFATCQARTLIVPEEWAKEADVLGRIEQPDACDYRLSPDSFVSRRPIAVGDDGCEHLTPATLPLQEFRLYQAVRIDPPSAEPDTGIELQARARIDSIRQSDGLHWGEILELRQIWTSVGHSLGEIKYSLPLAPGEATRLAMIDWSRTDTFSRSDNTLARDDLKHRQTYDRDIGEIVEGSLGEVQAGRSEIGGISAGLQGMYKGSGWGVSGAVQGGYAAGAAHSSGNRDIVGDTLQSLQGNTLQRSAMARSQFSTVIVQATQAESSALSTRIVANMNRAHTLTIQYYEVLRHLIVRTEYVGRSAALFVPFEPFAFTEELALRFRTQLEPALLGRRWRSSFDALERKTVGNDAYALEEAIEPLTLDAVAMPAPVVGAALSHRFSAKGGVAPYEFSVLSGALPAGLKLDVDGTLSGTPTTQGAQSVVLSVEDSRGVSASANISIVVGVAAVAAKASTVRSFRFQFVSGPHGAAPDTGGTVRVAARMRGGASVDILTLTKPITQLELFETTKPQGWSVTTGTDPNANNELRRIAESPWLGVPAGQTVDLGQIDGIDLNWKPIQLIGAVNLDGWNLKSWKITARTDDAEYVILDHSYQLAQGLNASTARLFPPRDAATYGSAAYNEAVNQSAPYLKPSQIGGGAAAVAGSMIATGSSPGVAAPLAGAKPGARKEADRALVRMLIDHLNANAAHYNNAVWLGMEPSERRRRIAPVVGSLLSGLDDRVVAVSGNHLGFLFRGEPPGWLLERAAAPGPEPIESIVTLPTRGVFAEAHLGHCNAAELRDITRYWAMDELPVSLLPNIESLRPGVLGQMANVTPQALQANALSIQTTPNMPDPSGLSDALRVLGTANLFRDMSGLEQVNNILGRLIEAARPPSLTGEKGSPATGGGAQRGSGGGGTLASGQPAASGPGARAPTSGGGQSGGSGGGGTSARPELPPYDQKPTQRYDNVVVNDKAGKMATSETGPKGFVDGAVDFSVTPSVPILRQPTGETCWAAVAAMMIAWRQRIASPRLEAVIATLGPRFEALLSQDSRLPQADKQVLLRQANMEADTAGWGNVTPQVLLDLLQTHGPLWITLDGDPNAASSAHSVIISGIRGDGTDAGTKLEVIDPARTGAQPDPYMPFRTFIQSYEDLVRQAPQNARPSVQIVRFADTAAEGATAGLTHMDVLTQMVQSISMRLTADQSRILQEPPANARVRTVFLDNPEGWKALIEIGNELRAWDLSYPVAMDHGGGSLRHPVIAARKLEWRDVAVEVPGANASITLALSQDHLLGELVCQNDPKTMDKNTSSMFPLARTIESSMLLLYGWRIDGGGAVHPLDFSAVPPEGLYRWLAQSGTTQNVTTSDTIILGLWELTLCKEDEFFQPGPRGMSDAPGPGAVARFYPLLSLWSSKPLTRLAANLRLERPERSKMAGMAVPMAQNGLIQGSFYADNNEFRSLWDDLPPATQQLILRAPHLIAVLLRLQSRLPARMASLTIVAIMNLLPSTRWSSLFSHYLLAPSTAQKKLMVSPTVMAKTITGIRGRQDAHGAGYSTTTVYKEDRQGAYDNVHLAPAMTYRVKAGTTTHEKTAYMAPICHHDCLHIHWRWGAWQDQDHVMGWQGGLPHRKAGAPLIPENQTLHVGIDGHAMEYEPSVENVSPLDWQIFMHHGAGISVDLNIFGYLAGLSEFSSETEVRKFLEDIYDGHDALMHLTNFYYHNRMLEPSVPGDAAMDEPRLDEGAGQTNFLPLE